MTALKLEHASIGELMNEFFVQLPEPDDKSFDNEAIITCATICLELRRRAVDNRNIGQLRDVQIMRNEIRDIVATIRQNASGASTGLLLPGSPNFHL